MPRRAAIVARAATSPTIASPAAARLDARTGSQVILSVLGRDGAGEKNLTYSWSVASMPAGAPTPVFSTNGTNAAKRASVVLGAPGVYRFHVVVTNPAGRSVNSSVRVTVASRATRLAIDWASLTLGLGETRALAATVVDQFDRPIGRPGPMVWSANVGTITKAGRFTAPSTPTTATISARSGSLSGTAMIPVVSRNEPPTLRSVSVDAIGSISAHLLADALDDGGAPNLSYSWSLAAGPSGAPSPIFSGEGPDVTATFGQAGSYTIRLTVRDQDGLSATSVIDVDMARTAASIVVSPDAASLAPGQSLPFLATVRDQFGQVMTPSGIAWSATSGSIDASGQFVANGGPSRATVAAAINGLRAEAAVSVDNAPPTITGIVGADQPIAGASATLTALANDDAGPENLTYAWAVTSSPAGASAPTFSRNGTTDARSTALTFSAVGSYVIQITATDQGGLSARSSTTVTVAATLSSIAVSPGDAPIKLGRNLAFSAAGLDQFGRPMGLSSVAWAARLGSIGPDGNYQATTAGDDVITASVGLISGTATARVRPNQPPQLTGPGVTASPAVVTGTTTTLSAFVSDPDDDPSSLTYTWTVIASPAGAPSPTFSTNSGLASSSVVTFGQAGSYQFQVSVADPEAARAIGTTQVVVSAVAASLTVAPGAVTLTVGQTRSFSATAIDQFGQPVATPAIDWTATSGTITAAGQLTAGASSAAGSVSARIGSVVASAGIGPNFGLSQPAILTEFTADFADGAIDRNEMIRILNAAGQNGVVTQGGLNDLVTILGASAAYHVPGYVQSLASSVVNGSPANAHYQGAPLGNLSAGSPASQLTKLVNKWFLGTDHPNTSVPYLNYQPTYALATGALFQSGPSSADMRQGQVGDCYLISTLGAIAQANPTAISNMIRDNGDDTWTVRFYAGGSPQYVTVDRYLPVDGQGRLIFADMGAPANAAATELWMPLIEKAYAQWFETGVPAPSNSGRNAYASIDTGYLITVENHLVGAAASQWDWYGGGFATNAARIVARLNQPGVAVTAATTANPGGGLVGNHAYVVASYDAATGLFLLVNPWGTSYPTISLTAAQMDQWVLQVVAQDTTSSVRI